MSITYRTFHSPLLWGTLVVNLISGCKPSAVPAAISSSTPALPSELLIVGIDRSESTALNGGRERQLDQLDHLEKLAKVNNRVLEIWAFDKDAVLIWGPGLPTSSRELDEVKAKQLTPKPDSPRRGTRPALLLKSIESDATYRRNPKADIVILSDGEAEIPEDRKIMDEFATKLNQTQSNRLWLIGTTPEARKDWDRAFSMTWGIRYRAFGPSEDKIALQSIFQN